MPSRKRDAENTWSSLTDSAVANIYRLVSASDGLVFSIDTIGSYKSVTAWDVLLLSDNLETNSLPKTTPTSFLALFDEAVGNGIKYGIVVDTLSLTSTAISGIKNGIASSVIAFTDDATKTAIPKIEEIEHNISTPWDEVDILSIDISDPDAVEALFATVGLRDSATVTIINSVSAISYLNLSQSSGPTIQASASTHIHLSDVLEKVLYDNPEDVLHFVQTATYYYTNPVESILNLTHTVDADGVLGGSATSTISFDDIVSFYRIGDLCVYDPGVGAGPPAPSMSDPVLIRRSTIVLTYPYNTPTLTLELRNPDFDTTEQLEFTRVIRNSRGGTLKMFRDPIWPASERFIYSFNTLKHDEKKAVLNFLQRSLGKEIGLLDFESRQWKCIILTPATQAERASRVGNTITLEFELVT